MLEDQELLVAAGGRGQQPHVVPVPQDGLLLLQVPQGVLEPRHGVRGGRGVEEEEEEKRDNEEKKEEVLTCLW